MRMKPFGDLINRQEAMKLIYKNIKQITRTEKVLLDEATDRVLAVDIVAEFNVPPFDRASMDGYAVKAKNTKGASEETPVKLKLKGVQHAGEIFLEEISNGECLEISTGSPMPIGSDAVVMVEYTSLETEFVLIGKPVKLWENVASTGEDIKIGDKVVRKGAVLTPRKIGAIAALGFSIIEVYEKPKVVIYSSGSEIVPQGQPLEPGHIYDINSFTLSSVIQANGCTPLKRGIIKDTVDSIISSLKDVTSFDMVVFSGGSSVGPKDLFGSVIEDLGKIYFHGVKVKPGKPTLFGMVEDIPVFGMPGYPTSCLSNSYIFLSPALRKLAALPPKEYMQITIPLGHSIKASSDREQFITVKVENGKAFRVFKRSGDITSMSEADGFIVMQVGNSSIDEGEEVIVTLLE